MLGLVRQFFACSRNCEKVDFFAKEIKDKAKDVTKFSNIVNMKKKKRVLANLANFRFFENIIYVIAKNYAKLYFNEGKIARWMFSVSRNEKCTFSFQP